MICRPLTLKLVVQFSLVVLLVLGMIALLPASAQEPPSAPDAAQAATVDGDARFARLYDVRRLLEWPLEWDFASLFHMQRSSEHFCYNEPFSLFDPVGPPEVRIGRARKFVEALTGLAGIDREQVDMSEKAGCIVVRGTAEEHQRVAGAVDELLQARLRTLVVTLAAVELNADLANEIAIGGQTVFNQPQDRRKLLSGIARVHARYLLTGSDGQPLCVNAGTLSNYVHSLEPVIAAGGVGFNIDKQQTLTGLSARIVAELMPDKRQVGVDFAFCYLRELSRESIRIEAAVPENVAAAPLHLITALADQHAGTVTMLLDAPTIVAAATVPEGLLKNDADPQAKVELFYILTVRVDDRRAKDDQSIPRAE